MIAKLRSLNAFNRHRKQCINTEHSDIVNKWSTFHTFAIYWNPWKTVAGWAPADLYFVPMPTCTALPPNDNCGLFIWSKWSNGLIYVSGLYYFGPMCIPDLTKGYKKTLWEALVNCKSVGGFTWLDTSHSTMYASMIV